jgi:hypothetical protein
MAHSACLACYTAAMDSDKGVKLAERVGDSERFPDNGRMGLKAKIAV